MTQSSPATDRSDLSRTASERRASPRRKILERATVVFNNGWSELRSVVLDVSEGGARLRLSDTGGCPEAFALRWDRTGLTCRCRIAWRRGQDVGIQWAAASGAH